VPSRREEACSEEPILLGIWERWTVYGSHASGDEPTLEDAERGSKEAYKRKEPKWLRDRRRYAKANPSWPDLKLERSKDNQAWQASPMRIGIPFLMAGVFCELRRPLLSEPNDDSVNRAIEKVKPRIASIAGIVLVALVSNHSANANDSDRQRVSSILPACRSFTSPDGTFMQGYCAGLIEGLSFLSRGLPPREFRSCIPEGVTISQMTTVVVRWLEQHPQRGNENFKGLALTAFHDAWPCQ
jgi:hypothetical protein